MRDELANANRKEDVMKKNISKTATGQVVAENISGKAVPRKGGLVDETQGKSIGKGNVRKTGGRDTRKAR